MENLLEGWIGRCGILEMIKLKYGEMQKSGAQVGLLVVNHRISTFDAAVHILVHVTTHRPTSSTASQVRRVVCLLVRDQPALDAAPDHHDSKRRSEICW